MNAAEVLWTQSIQLRSFSEELTHLSSKSKHSPPARVSLFGLFLDDLHLLRYRGRINNSQLSTGAKSDFASIKSPLGEISYSTLHQEIKHSGIVDTLSTIQERYWILKGRQAVKKMLRSCVTCSKLEAVPYSSVVPPNLPSILSFDDPPFAHSGIDFASPLFVKAGDRSEKA